MIDWTRTAKRLLALMLLLSLMASALSLTPPIQAQAPEPPKSVTIAGTLQSKLGCPGDWQPACDKTFLTYSEKDDLWIAEFELEPGDYEYKAALNGSWDENYGAKAERNGPNIPLKITEKRKVIFWYSRATNWVSDNVNSILANVPGSYQSEIGCPGDWQPACLRSLLQDPDGDGKYTFTTSAIPEGDYEAKVAVNLSWAENYGAQGARDGANIAFTSIGKEIVFEWDTTTKIMNINVAGAPKGNLRAQRAFWGTRDTFVWPAKVPDPRRAVFTLHYDPNGAMELTPEGIRGGETLPLTWKNGVPDAITVKFPHWAASYSLALSPEDALKAPDILKGQIALSARDANGELLDAAGVQIPGVLDELFSYNGALGVSIQNGAPTLAVWAPTARTVALHLFDDPNPATAAQRFEMSYDPVTGVWSVQGRPDWMNKYYLYEVQVFVPATGKIETNLVTDPYSISLSMNSKRSQIVDLNDPALMPPGWTELQKPPLAAPEDIVIYELHVRDFSIKDETVPEALRGTFKAFTLPDSNGMKHLRALAQAGLTHIHLLPFFDIATIDEDKTTWRQPDMKELATFPPDSDKQQAAVMATKGQDGYNWGYDPYHYTTPEGSYSTNPDGPTRILELREAIMALNAAGLRVIMDVVYNHTNASGQSEKSVLDRIVPGYYHRLNADGRVERSTCCENTATEHTMMEKLMIDSLVTWTTAYKMDGFRFDLMGHHMLSNMIKVRETLDSLTPEATGIDGKAVYIYGEGWNFGEVENDRRGKNARQANLGGTGIGSFNDRLRDAVRGGNPFGDRQIQGFVNGLFDDPNGIDTSTPQQQKDKLLRLSDHIRVGLAGNLVTYTLVNFAGNLVPGTRISYNRQPTAYTRDPQENVVYSSKHDNETLFDMIQYKAPLATPMADRVRMQNLGMALVMFAQGVPFFQAGDDMLRSKSFDRDSYDSGDWFNGLDFTYNSNGYGLGLPVEDKNKEMWPVIGPLLANPALKPSREDILTSVENFKALLQIRRSSKLFRLETAEDVQARLTFYNVGPDQIPALIAMSLSDAMEPDLDPAHEMIFVVFNASKSQQTLTVDDLKGMAFTLHPVQAEGSDPVVKTSTYDAASGTFTVPARTVAVFVVKQ